MQRAVQCSTADVPLLNGIVGTLVSLSFSTYLSLLSRVVSRPGFIPVVVPLLPFFTEFHASIFYLSPSLSLFRAPTARSPLSHPFHSFARPLYFSLSNSRPSSARSSRSSRMPARINELGHGFLLRGYPTFSLFLFLSFAFFLCASRASSARI